MTQDNTVKNNKYKSWISIFFNSLKENDEDFTTTPIKIALPMLAIPMMIELSMEAIFAVVDITFVSFLGTNAVAAVGITEALITVLYAVSISHPFTHFNELPHQNRNQNRNQNRARIWSIWLSIEHRKALKARYTLRPPV